jgi:hypothetical protein
VRAQPVEKTMREEVRARKWAVVFMWGGECRRGGDATCAALTTYHSARPIGGTFAGLPSFWWASQRAGKETEP